MRKVLMYSHYLLIILCFLNPIVAIGQPYISLMPETGKGNIQGNIMDKDQKGIPGVAIWLKGTGKSTISDQAGYFEIKNIPGGVYTLVIQSVQFKSLEQEIEIKENETVQQNITVEEQILELSEVQVTESYQNELQPMKEIEGVYILAGKKSELIDLRRSDANLSISNTRQVFNKTPGISIWENDGSGIQVGIASRGLSPNRSWEFNVRQNGYDIASDPLGYPEAYYNPPMEAVAQIQLLRGAASLQFGPQFGGMINYVLKKANPDKAFSFETQNTFGSNRLFNTYNALGGTKGKFSYYAYHHYRTAEGWRNNAGYYISNASIQLGYSISKRIRIGFEYTHSQFVSQQPGGLTDAQFATDARQSNRSRNWLGLNWNIANLSLDYKVSENTKMNLKVFGLMGERGSIGYVRSIEIRDTLNATGNYNPRQIDKDQYKNWGAELRMLSDYQFFGAKHSLSYGIRYFYGSTIREQLGKGDTETGYNLILRDTQFPRSLQFSNDNFAAFVENLFHITSRWSLTPGLRFESIRSQISGRINIKADGSEDKVQESTQQRYFLLMGLGTEYRISPLTSFYANYSSAYRPILFSDITPAATTAFKIDPDLKDASGFNIDLGYRGSVKEFLTFDVSAFYLNYGNRIGTISQIDANNAPYQYRTNLGTTIHQGIEAYLELSPMKIISKTKKWGNISLFASLSWIDARYQDFKNITIQNGQQIESNLKGNRVENAANYIHRFGLNYTLKGFSLTYQISFVGDTYADANNTETPSANAQTGKIPSYEVMDLSGSCRIMKNYLLKFGINNLSDRMYFTRRSSGYPGPGLLPSDGRTFFLTLGAKF